MKRFESFLSQQFEDYMLYRHQLGYDTYSLRRVLKTLDCYLVSQNAGPSDLTPTFFLSLQANLRTQYKSMRCLMPPAAAYVKAPIILSKTWASTWRFYFSALRYAYLRTVTA